MSNRSKAKESMGQTPGRKVSVPGLAWAKAGLVAMFVLLAALSSPAAEQPSGDVLLASGLQAYQRGAFDQAAVQWKDAAKGYEREGRTLERSRALVHLAQAYQALGQLTKSLQTLELALALSQASNDPSWVASILDSLGRAYLTAGKLEPAQDYYDQALGVAWLLARPDLTAIILNDMAILQAAQGKHAEAMEAANESAELAAIGGQ